MPRSQATQHTFSVLLLLVSCAGFLLIGCSRQPVVEHNNLHLVASLRTACSAQNETWLLGVERAVVKRFDEGAMSEPERDEFTRLIALAKSGDWQSAESACFSWEKAQLSRTRAAPDEDSHSHSHDHLHTHASEVGK